MNDFKNKILDGIKTGEIKAESKWRFLAHDYFFWFLAGVSTIFGAIAFASVLHRVAINQVELAPRLRDLESVSVFIQTLPYLWIVIVAILGLASWFNFKKTSKAYKHQLVVFLGMLIISMLFGGVLFAAGVGSKVDEGMRKHVPAFKKEQMRKQELRNKYIQKKKNWAEWTEQNKKRPYSITPPQRLR